MACDDNGCNPLVNQSRLTFAATTGQDFLIRIGSAPTRPGGTGRFEVRCLVNGTPPNRGIAASDVKVRTRGGGILDIFVGTQGGAFLSSDGGQNFANLSSGAAGLLPLSGRVEIAFAPSNQGTLYSSVDVNGGEIWRSTDFGSSWSQRSTGSNYLCYPDGTNCQGGYDNAIWVAPDDVNLVVVGGIDLWRSTDGGRDLEQISNWRDYRPPARTDSAHADQHIIIHHPSYDGQNLARIFVGNDGGIFRNDDIVNTGQNDWTELNNQLGITQFYKGAGGGAFGGYSVIGGTQDNNTLRVSYSWSVPSTESWYQWIPGDGGYCAVNYNDRSIMYEEYVYLAINKSTNGGDSYAEAVEILPWT